MKIFILIFFSFVLVASTTLWVKGNTAQIIQTEIEIAAPPEKVWSILTNFNHWDKWNPVIVQASGTSSLGSTLDITMVGEAGKSGPQYNPMITHYDEAKLFRWRAKMMAGFLFTNDKIFELQETDSGTRLIHKEIFSGMLAPIFSSKFDEGVTPILNAMNDALKIAVEKPLI